MAISRSQVCRLPRRRPTARSIKSSSAGVSSSSTFSVLTLFGGLRGIESICSIVYTPRAGQEGRPFLHAGL